MMGQMGRIISFLASSVDGYYEGPNQEFDWPVVDDEFNEFSVAHLDEFDTLMFGRVTYEGMAAFWPTAAAQEDDPRVAERMNRLPKIVVSHTLKDADWNNTRVLGGDIATELAALKAESGGDILILGSSNLTVSLMELGILDELRLMVMPVVLGAGRSLFRTAEERFPLRLTGSRTFTSGNVLLFYEPTTRA